MRRQRPVDRRRVGAGFTLMELLLVIGIMAALVGLALPYYQDYVGQSKNSIMRANLHALRKTLMEYRADKGEYPPTLEILQPQYFLKIPEDPEDKAPASWGYVRTEPGTYTLAVKYQ
jgi:general secretion pathway protein G